MRWLITLFAVFLFSGFASAQAGFGHGHSDWDPPGLYSDPFQPLATTPSVSLDSVRTPSMSLDPVAPATGASNATTGSGNVYAQAAWSGSPATEVREEVSLSESQASGQASGFDFGAALFPSDYGAAQLMERPSSTQAKLYTNPDVEAVNQTNGLVKFKGRTEHLD